MSIQRNPFFLLIIILVALVVVIVYRYDQYVVKRDFLLTASVTCDPSKEACFVADCDAGDPACDKTPYKKVSILSSEAPGCVQEHTCGDFQCDGRKSCVMTYCTDAVLGDGEICTLP